MESVSADEITNQSIDSSNKRLEERKIDRERAKKPSKRVESSSRVVEKRGLERFSTVRRKQVQVCESSSL
ncbi:hypothetical protein ACOSQ2_012008 [Xanthoceras sorbifolium]